MLIASKLPPTKQIAGHGNLCFVIQVLNSLTLGYESADL